MERSGTTTVRPHNPKFAILGLSQIGSRSAGVTAFSSSLSVSCFGGTGSTSVDHDEKMEVASPRPMRHSTDEVTVRQLSTTKASRRRHATAAAVDRRPSKPLSPPATNSRSVQVSTTVSCGRTNQRSSHGYTNRNPLASDSLVIRPLRGSAAACSNSADWSSTKRGTGTRSRTKAVGESSSRRDLLVLPPTTIANDDDLRGTSTVAGRHLDVFLPSLVARQNVESDE